MAFLLTRDILTLKVRIPPLDYLLKDFFVDCCCCCCCLGDWEMFTAATCSPETRDMFIHDLATWINETPTNKAYTDLYDTVEGK
jgi:hypothetical protein